MSVMFWYRKTYWRLYFYHRCSNPRWVPQCVSHLNCTRYWVRTSGLLLVRQMLIPAELTEQIDRVCSRPISFKPRAPQSHASSSGFHILCTGTSGIPCWVGPQSVPDIRALFSSRLLILAYRSFIQTRKSCGYCSASCCGSLLIPK